MPKFRVTSPSGQTVEIEAPDEQHAIAIAKTVDSVRQNTAMFQGMEPQGIGQHSNIRPRPGPPQRRKPQGGLALNFLDAADDTLATTADQLLERLVPGSSYINPAQLARNLTTPRIEANTEGERWARTAGTYAPGAAMPGGPVARVANVVLPTIGAEGSAAITRAFGGDESAQDKARVVGGILGAAVTGARPNARPGPPPARGNMSPNSAGIRAATKGISPQQMQEAAARLRGAGAEPSLVDVVGEQGRGTIRAAASRNTPARQQVQDFADARAQNLPDRMSQQARRVMSNDPRTPDQIAAELGQQRATQAADQFGAVRGEPVGTLGEVDHPYVQAAIREAAMRERDPAVREALATMKPGDTVTVGMADRISRVLSGQAEAAARSGDNDLAATFRSLSADIRGPARQVVPGYGDALDNYAAQSRIMDAAGRGEDFLARNTDEFTAGLQDLGPEGLPLARATGRRAIERAAGENISAAPGVARRLALAPEQQARNRALLGDEDAQRLQDAMGAEVNLVDNARFVAPRTGSQTQGRMQDAASPLADVAQTALDFKTGGFSGIIRKVVADMRNKGLSDADAQLLAEAAIDPARLDAIIADIERRQPQIAQQLRQALPRAAVAGALVQPEKKDTPPRPGPPQ